MMHSPVLDAKIKYQVVSEAYQKALRLSQTRQQAALRPKLMAAKHALLSAENKAARLAAFASAT